MTRDDVNAILTWCLPDKTAQSGVKVNGRGQAPDRLPPTACPATYLVDDAPRLPLEYRCTLAEHETGGHDWHAIPAVPDTEGAIVVLRDGSLYCDGSVSSVVGSVARCWRPDSHQPHTFTRRPMVVSRELLGEPGPDLASMVHEQLREGLKVTPPERVYPKVVSAYAPLAERVCGHGHLTRYNLSVPYLRHEDGTACDTITLMNDPRYGSTGHPIDPVVCVNGLGGRCGPSDCVLNHTVRGDDA